jgi:TRAP-type mannitol/chloroaromatic compound transport system substrate-binding protein
MDRRTFLKSTGAAAAGTAAASLPATSAETPAAPALGTGTRELTLATAWSLDTPVYGDSVTRLAHRIETATGGRYRIVQSETSRPGLAAVANGAADLYHAPEHLHLEAEPALAYFAALPAPFGLDAQSFQAWLVAGGGQMLWDDLAGDLGVKPLMAGHTGPAVGLWLNRPLPDGDDGYRGLRLNVFGLAGKVLQQLRGEPHALPPGDIAAALADGRLDGAEWAGPMANVAAGIHRSARHVVPRAFNPHGSAYTLGINRNLWESLAESDRAIFEACAAEEVRISTAEAVAHRRIAWKSVAERHGVVADLRRTRQPEALAAAAQEVVAAVAASSPKAERIDASYRSFAELVRGRRRTRPPDRIA